MQAIAATAGSTEPLLVELPDPPAPGPGQVLCRTLELGVCGTDREILQSGQPLAPPGRTRLVLGHECLARVEAVGPGVDDLTVGSLVVPIVRRACPQRMSRLPREAAVRVDMLAFGSFTERGIVWEDGFSQPRWLDEPRHLFAIDAPLAEVAVLVEPVAVAEKGLHEAWLLNRARLGDEAWPAAEPGANLASPPAPAVLVTGLGPIAFAAIVAARARGWPVAVWGRDADDTSRARLAQDFGAVYLPAAGSPLAPADVEAEGFDLVLECTGSDEVMLRAALAARSRGVIVWLGSTRHPQATQHNVARLMREGLLRNHLHLGCVNAAPRDFRAAIADLAAMAALAPDCLRRMITARVAPSESLWHYAHRQPQGIKTVLVYD